MFIDKKHMKWLITFVKKLKAAPMLQFNIVQAYLRLLPKLMYGDSFHGQTLSLFYLRQLLIVQKRVPTIPEAGPINPFALSYQSFIPIILCYKYLNRPSFIFFCNIILMAGFFIAFESHKAVTISVIYWLSSVAFYHQIERGNYQFLGLIFAVLDFILFQEYGLNSGFYFLYFILPFFSVSTFILLNIIICSDLVLGGLFNSLFNLLLSGFLASFIFLVGNLFFISRASKSQLIDGFRDILMPLHVVGGGFFSETHANLSTRMNLRRPLKLLNGLMSIVPFAPVLFLFPIDGTGFAVTLILVLLMFLNQSRIFRLFDFHLLYCWIFLIVLVLIDTQETWSIAAVWIVGTNPIFVFAMSYYSDAEKRGFTIDDPVMVSNEKRDLVLKNMSMNFNKDDILVLPANEKITSYDDLWRHEALAQEWVSHCCALSGRAFFPDYFSLFYTPNGKKVFSELLNGRGIGKYYWHFDKSVPEIKDRHIDFFNYFFPEIVESYFDDFRYLICVEKNDCLEISG